MKKEIRIKREGDTIWVSTYINGNYCGGSFKDEEEVTEIERLCRKDGTLVRHY